MKIIVILFIGVFFKQTEADDEEIFTIRSKNGVLYGGELLDLTHSFDNSTLGYPGLKPFELIVTHRGMTDDNYWLQTEDYSGDMHVGTHFDAPCHIIEGKWSVEEIPLNRLMAPAAVIDISHRSEIDKDTNLEIEDLIEWERNTKQSLDGTIVLVNSGWGEKWCDEKEFLGTDTPSDTTSLHFPGVSPEAAEWVSKNRRIYGLGIDTTSLDNGHDVHHRRAHQALFSANIYGLENVANLHYLPASGAFLFVFPMRIKEACGAPVRVIALVPNDK